MFSRVGCVLAFRRLYRCGGIRPDMGCAWKVLAALALVPVLLPAQDTTAIFGTVLDRTDAVIPDAEATLSNAGSAQTWKTRTNDAGVFRFPGMVPGDYALSVSARGSKATTVQKATAQGPRRTCRQLRSTSLRFQPAQMNRHWDCHRSTSNGATTTNRPSPVRW